MQYLRNFSKLQFLTDAAKRIAINKYCCIVLTNKISSQTTFVRHKSEFDSWVSTALDIIACRPSSEQDKSKNEPTSVKFIPDQIAPSERRLGKLIAEHTKRKEIFYGIELAAHSFSIPMNLDYNQFGNHMPLFTALIWLGKEYGPVVRLIDVEMIRFALQLQPHTIVLPHFACNSADHERLLELLALNFLNVFVIRGNQPTVQNQVFPETADLVREIRRIKEGNISIGVGGYPEGHMEARTLEENMEMLKKKVDAGADYIMTKICFCSSTLIDFVKNCRDYGITIPIVVGVYVPESVCALCYVSEFMHVTLSPADIAQYATNADNPELFKEYAKRQTVHLISDLLESNLDIYGFQFFTMNNFDPIHDVMSELYAIEKMKSDIKENISNANESITLDVN